MLPRMNIQQRRRANKLLKHLCANYQDGNCLLLDDDTTMSRVFAYRVFPTLCAATIFG